MTIDHSAWRVEFGRRLVERISTFEGVQAIVIGGSVARGYVDAYSDLELPIFWDRTPGDETRLGVVAAIGGRFLYEYNGPAMEDQLLINGFQVDLQHQVTAREEAVIEDVLQGLTTDLGDSNFLDTIRTCIPLYGQEIIQAWKQRALLYPEQLAIKIIREQISNLEWNHLPLSAHRENPSMFYADIVKIQQTLFLILLALNKEYFPTYKWMYRSFEDMKIKPDSIEGRFRRMFAQPYERAAAEARQVVSETLGLIERQFPSVDTATARRRLAYVRAAHPGPVEFSASNR